jgi:nucleoside-diphosphate kinase
MNRTFVIVKPDGVARGLVGEIIGRFESKGLRLVALEQRTIDRATAERHYAEHVGKDFYEPLLAFMTGSPSVLAVLEGPDGTWALVRSMMGATNPLEATPGSIRGDFASSTRENLVHGSDSPESAAREIALFFPHLS